MNTNSLSKYGRGGEGEKCAVPNAAANTCPNHLSGKGPCLRLFDQIVAAPVHMGIAVNHILNKRGIAGHYIFVLRVQRPCVAGLLASATVRAPPFSRMFSHCFPFMKPLALTHFKLSSNCSGVKWVSMLIILPYQNLGVIRGLPMKSMPG